MLASAQISRIFFPSSAFLNIRIFSSVVWRLPLGPFYQAPDSHSNRISFRGHDQEDLCPDELGVFLIETALDENQDPVIRDYAVQFIPQWLTNSGPNESGVEGDVETREALLGVLEETLTLRHESIAGTALLGLNELASQEVLSLEDYRKDAVAAAIGRDVHPLTRITALQVAAEHGWAEALPVVRQLIDDPETSGSLRLSAIAALGALGTESDRHWFVAARNNHPEERFGGALVAAQQRLQARLND